MIKKTSNLKLYKPVRAILSCFAVALFLCSLSAHAEPIWQGKNQYKDDYLIGTIHVGDERINTLSDRIKRTIDKVDVVAVEVDLSNVSASKQQQEVMRLALLPGDQTITQVISPAMATKVNTYLNQHGANIFQYQKFKPWMVAIIMVQMSYKKMGLLAENGIDQQIIEYAKQKNKTIVELETFSEQLNLFNRLFENAEDVNYDDMLQDTLDELKNMSDMPNQMLEAWLTADMTMFDDIYNKTLKTSKYDARLEQLLLVERNKKWQVKLNPQLDAKSVLVATGTLHYVGDSGLPKLLNGQFELIK